MAERKIDPPSDTTGSAKVLSPSEQTRSEFYTHPDGKTVEEVGKLAIYADDGTKRSFQSLWEGQCSRQLIIFIRHFYCGNCEEYIRALATRLSPSILADTSPPTTLIIIGCGDPACIPDYRARTMSALGSTPFQLYSDPSRKIYERLGMVCSLRQGEETPEYFTKSRLSVAFTSIGNALKSGSKAFKGGPSNQNGGEMLFEAGHLRWFHRMSNTADHASIAELKEVVGLE